MTYDRAAIMRDAHKRYRDGKRLGLGWTFGQCLSTAWRAAIARRKAIYEEMHPETKNGENQHTRVRQVGEGSPAYRFTSDTAAKTGQSERRVQRDAERGEALAVRRASPRAIADGTSIDLQY